MGNNLSTPEKISKLARNGDANKLELLLTDLQRNDAQFRSSRARYLEVAEGDGSTPLTLAAARGSVACVRLLLQFGANIRHVNDRPDGGSALHEAVAHRHAAVVEVLLSAGANPFVENVRGFTAMDIACSSRNTQLLRRLERCAPYSGWLLAKVPQFGGLGSSWQRRWVVVCHRYPNPKAPAARQLTHCVFLAYKTLQNTAPSCRVWLDGARAREVYNPKAEARLQYSTTNPAPRLAQIGVVLHRKHEVPSGLFTTGGGQSASGAAQPEGCTFYLRPDEGTVESVKDLERLMRTINNRGFPPTSTAPTTPTAGAGASAAASSAAAANSASSSQQPTPQQQQQQGLPPPPSPLFSSIPGPPYPAVGPGPAMPMATAPGEWSHFGAPPPTESDEQLARRLQEEYDAEIARQMQQQGGSPPPAVPGSSSAYQQQAQPPSFVGAGSSGGSFYPTVHGAGAAVPQPGSAPAPHGPPTATGPLYPTSSAPAALAADMQAAAAGAAGAGAGGNGNGSGGSMAGDQATLTNPPPSAPTLLDMDYPPITMPLAGHLPISASGRHQSAPRLEDDSWWAANPAAPPSRAASESQAAAAAATGASAPPAASAAAAAQGGNGGNGSGSDSDTCVYCMDAPAIAGVLHGDSVHKCLCPDCAAYLRDSQVKSCPMCREDIQAYIMRVF